MKSFVFHTIFAAATLVVFANSSPAQVLTAEIPFAFRAGNTLMQPGSYEIARVHTASMAVLIRLYSRDDRRSLFVPVEGRSSASKSWVAAAAPKLSFDCVETRCAMRRMWTGEGEAYDFTGPKLKRDEPVHVAEIRLSASKGE